MQPLIFETEPVMDYWDAEDSGSALILTVDPAEGHEKREYGGEFVRLQSWTEFPEELAFECDKSSADDMRRMHPILGQLIGRRVRVTVEVLD